MDSLELTHPYLLHPRTGEPLRAVGIVAGRPVWPMIGGDGTEGDANDQDGDQDGADDTDQDGADQDQDGDQDDPRVARASRQAANYRTQLRETEGRVGELETQLQQSTEVLDRLRAAITGDDGGDGEGDPAEQVAELTTEVETLRTTNADLQRAVLVYELAGEAGGNPTALLDSRRFGDELRALDASADNYRDQVAEAIRTAVSKTPAYAAGQGSARGGGELDGKRREQQRQRPAGGLRGAVGAALGS